jgi:hypothetical protein
MVESLMRLLSQSVWGPLQLFITAVHRADARKQQLTSNQTQQKRQQTLRVTDHGVMTGVHLQHL